MMRLTNHPVISSRLAEVLFVCACLCLHICLFLLLLGQLRPVLWGTNVVRLICIGILSFSFFPSIDFPPFRSLPEHRLAVISSGCGPLSKFHRGSLPNMLLSAVAGSADASLHTHALNQFNCLVKYMPGSVQNDLFCFPAFRSSLCIFFTELEPPKCSHV